MSNLKVKCPSCFFVYDLTTKAKVKRSLNQNDLYWSWMTFLGNDIGYSKEAMHYVFKRQFLADKMPVLGKDEFMEYLRGLNYKEASTRRLNVGEMKEYLDRVFEQATELNVVLPLEVEK